MHKQNCFDNMLAMPLRG